MSTTSTLINSISPAVCQARSQLSNLEILLAWKLFFVTFKWEQSIEKGDTLNTLLLKCGCALHRKISHTFWRYLRDSSMATIIGSTFPTQNAFSNMNMLLEHI